MIDVIFGGTQVCVLLHFGPGVARWRYHNNHRFIMHKDNVSKVTLWIQNSLGIIMFKFRAVKSKTEGMAASVRVFLNTPCSWDLAPSCIYVSNRIKMLSNKKVSASYTFWQDHACYFLGFSEFKNTFPSLHARKKEPSLLKVLSIRSINLSLIKL